MTGEIAAHAPLHVAPAEGRRSVIVFCVGRQRYAIASCEIEQILPMAELDRPPGTPNLLAGFLNLAGDLVPVVRLHHLFGLAEVKLDLWTPLVLLRGTSERVALLVEQVDGCQIIATESILPLPEHHASDECVTGTARVGDFTIHLLSVERLLLKQERQVTAEWKKRVEQRVSELKDSLP